MNLLGGALDESGRDVSQWRAEKMVQLEHKDYERIRF